MLKIDYALYTVVHDEGTKEKTLVFNWSSNAESRSNDDSSFNTALSFNDIYYG